MGTYMHSQVGVNILIVLSGAAVVTVLFFLSQRFLAAQNPVRQWLANMLEKNGVVEVSRIVGLVLLMTAFGILTLWYS